MSTTTSSATTTTPNATDFEDQERSTAQKTKSTIAIVVVVVVLLLLFFLLLYRSLNKSPLPLPADPDAQITANKAFENPQYNAAHQGASSNQSDVYSPVELATGSSTRTTAGAAPAAASIYVSTGNSTGDDGESDIYRALDSGARNEQAGNANAQLYSVPTAEDDGGGDCQGVGAFSLPRGRAGTVVAEAASGSHEVVAEINGIYTPAAPAAAGGIRVMPAQDGMRYNHASHNRRPTKRSSGNGVDTYNRIDISGTTGGGGGKGKGGYDHIGTHTSSSSSSSSGRAGNADYDRINRNAGGGNAEESNYHDNSVHAGPTVQTSWDGYDMSSSGYQQVTPAEIKKGATAGRKKQGGGGGGGGGKKKPIAGRVSASSTPKLKIAGRVSAAATSPSAGVPSTSRAANRTNRGGGGGGRGGRGKGKSSYDHIGAGTAASSSATTSRGRADNAEYDRINRNGDESSYHSRPRSNTTSAPATNAGGRGIKLTQVYGDTAYDNSTDAGAGAGAGGRQKGLSPTDVPRVDHNNTYDKWGHQGRRTNAGPTVQTSWDNYDMSSSGYQQVTPAEPKKGATAGRKKQGGGGKKKPIAGRVSASSTPKPKIAGRVSAAATSPSTGVSRTSRARQSGAYGFEGGGGGAIVVRGRNQGVSVYQGFNVDEDEEV